MKMQAAAPTAAAGVSLATELPEGLAVFQLTPKALAIAAAVLEAVKESTIKVKQLRQTTSPKARANGLNPNGILGETTVPLHKQCAMAMDFQPTAQRDVLYMHNHSLIEVAGHELTKRLYSAVQVLDQDVLVDYPLLYVSNYPKSSSDVLVGSEGSWTPMHQDLPLYCTSAILVLEGHKEFAVVTDEFASRLPTIITSQMWEAPFEHQGVVFDNLQTLIRIEEHPENIMLFDYDFARLLEDCTEMILASVPSQWDSLLKPAQFERLPQVQRFLDTGFRVMEWYLTLQCIPKGLGLGLLWAGAGPAAGLLRGGHPAPPAFLSVKRGRDGGQGTP